MDIQEDDFSRENIKKMSEMAIEIIKELVRDIVNKYGGENASNIIKGTLCKCITRLNNFYLALRNLSEWIEEPTKLTKIAYFSFKESEIAKMYFISSRFDFFVGIFSLVEDAISNQLIKYLFNDKEINEMKFPEYGKILEDQDVDNLLEKKFSKIRKELSKQVNYPVFERMIKKLRKKKIISTEEESFLLGCKKIRNSIHSNGMNEALMPEELAALRKVAEEDFEINEKTPHHFLSLERMVKWSHEVIKIFVKIALKTDWKNIRDNTIKTVT